MSASNRAGKRPGTGGDYYVVAEKRGAGGAAKGTTRVSSHPDVQSARKWMEANRAKWYARGYRLDVVRKRT